MNPLIKTFSRENNFKHRRVTVKSFDVFVRVSPIFRQQICLGNLLIMLGIDKPYWNPVSL